MSGAARDYWVTVCDRCYRASCWHGVDLCREAREAGTTDVRRSELVQMKQEARSNYTRERLLAVCGDVREIDDEKEGC